MILALLALSLSADPAWIRLGRDASASVAIGCAQEPSIFPSSGSVEGLRKDGEVWRGTYLPPRGSIPRVALLAVFCGQEPALLPIPLWGDGDAEVHARPRAVVEVRIGDELFGPLRTDAGGVARVPVVVPPGVNFAYQGKRAIDLHVPPTRTVHLVALQGELAVDVPRTVMLYAFAVDRSGKPLEGAPLRATATRGALGAAEAVAPGVYRMAWSLEAGAPGAAGAEATVDGDPEPARVALALAAGPAAEIALEAERRELVAGEGPLRLQAVVRDAAGNPVDGAIEARSTRGAVRVTSAGAGRYQLELEVPGALGGDSGLRVSVTKGAARAETGIALRPASPAKLQVVAARPNVLADGRSAVRVRLRAIDRFGNEVPDPPAASADLGSVSAPARTPDGWEATFVPPVLHDRASAVVAARTGPAAATARIELDPSVRPVAISVRAGMFTNFHEVTAPTGGVVAALRTDGAGGQLGLQLSFDAIAWSSSDQLATSAGRRALRTGLAVLVPGLSAEWRRPLSERAAAWIAGGPVLAWASARTELAGADGMRDRGFSGGAQAGAGAELRAGRGRALFELRWLAVRSFALANLQGPLSGLCASMGYRMELF